MLGINAPLSASAEKGFLIIAGTMKFRKESNYRAIIKNPFPLIRGGF